MYFEFKGIKSTSMGVTVITQPPITFPESRMWREFVPGRHGERSTFLGYKPLEFLTEIVVEGRDNLDKVLGWLKGHGRYIRNDFPDRYTYVTVAGEVELNMVNEDIWSGSVTFLQHEPFWYGIDDEDKIKLKGPNEPMKNVTMLGVEEHIYEELKETLGEGKALVKKEHPVFTRSYLNYNKLNVKYSVGRQKMKEGTVTYFKSNFFISVIRGWTPYVIVTKRNSSGREISREIVELKRGVNEVIVEDRIGREDTAVEVEFELPKTVGKEVEVSISNTYTDVYLESTYGNYLTKGNVTPLPTIKIYNPNPSTSSEVKIAYHKWIIEYSFPKGMRHVYVDLGKERFFNEYNNDTGIIPLDMFSKHDGYIFTYTLEGRGVTTENLSNKNVYLSLEGASTGIREVEIEIYRKDRWL